MRAVLEFVDPKPCGTLEARFLKLSGDDERTGYHRTVFPPGIDIEEQMAAVNRHLADMGFSPVSDDDIKFIKDVAQLNWTQQHIDARKARETLAESKGAPKGGKDGNR